jgi:hypothetical protein
MSDPSRHLQALAAAATEAHRALEAAITTVDSSWDDDARRGFEADHLAAIRSDARLLSVNLSAITHAAAEAARELQCE